MLQIVLGRSFIEKTHYITNLILNSGRNNDESFILLVPETQVTRMENLLLNCLGEKFNNNVEILSFSTIKNYVYKKVKRVPSKAMALSEKIILMDLAIESVLDELILFNKSSKRPEFISLMIETLNELKKANVTDESLESFENFIDDKILRQKIYEVRLILNAYNSLISQKYSEPLDDLNKVYNILLENNIFNNYTVIVDGFDSFTNQQLLIIERILVQATNCYIALCSDGLNEQDTDIFFFSNKSLNKILTIAKNYNIEIVPNVLLDSKNHCSSDEFKILEENIFKNNKESVNKNPENIFLYSAQNKFEELNFVCSKILDLIINQNYRFKDIAIVARNINSYRGIADVYLKKYNILHFINMGKNTSYNPLLQLIFSLFEVIIFNFSTNSIIKYIKSGLLNFSSEDLASIENYTHVWNIEPEEWKTGFFKNPNGVSNSYNGDSEFLLIKLNELRSRIVEPLLELEKNLADSTAIEITKRVYEFLEHLGISGNLKKLAQKLLSSGQHSLAEVLFETWENLMETFSQFAEILDNKKISLSHYLDLLALTINTNKTSAAHRNLDEVIVESATDFVPGEEKVIFVIGATQGEFPAAPTSSGAFNDSERKRLLDFGFNLNPPLEESAIKEKFLAYKIITSASEKLFVSWPITAVTGEKKMESEIVKEIKNIFKGIKVHHRLSENLIDETFSLLPALDLCAATFKDNSKFSKTLKKYFYDLDEYKEKLERIQKLLEKKPIKFKNSNSINLLLKNKLEVSPSSIEQYYLCPFSFFCRYVLKLKKTKPAMFDSLEYGSLIHYILENIFVNYSSKNVLAMTHDELLKILDIYLTEYINKKFGGIANLSDRQKYLIKRSFSAVKPIILHVAEELDQSQFLPQDFELSICKNGKIKPLFIELEENKEIVVSGKIDRIDIMKKGGISYVRVVDYKTGSKDFKLSDLDYGLNIQMLLYIYIILQNGENTYGHMIPAGILYMPAKKPMFSANKNILLNKVQEQKLKKFQMKGLILNSNDVILGMEPDGSGKFIPVVIKDNEPKKSDTLVTLDEMNGILKRVYDTVFNMGNAVFNSDVSPLPIKGKSNACEHCEFFSICRFEENDPVKYKF